MQLSCLSPNQRYTMKVTHLLGKLTLPNARLSQKISSIAANHSQCTVRKANDLDDCEITADINVAIFMPRRERRRVLLPNKIPMNVCFTAYFY